MAAESLKPLTDAVRGAAKIVADRREQVVQAEVTKLVKDEKAKKMIEVSAQKSLNTEAYIEIKKALQAAKNAGITDKIILRLADLNGIRFDEAREALERLRRYKAKLLPGLDVETIPIPERLPAESDARNGRDPLFEVTMDEAREIAVRSLPEAIKVFKGLIKLPSDLNYLEGLIFCQQTRLKPILSVVLPLGVFNTEIGGDFGAAKTYLLRLLTSGADGEFIGGTTSSGFKRTLERMNGTTLGLDQIDLLIKTNPEMLNLLLLGNQWNVSYRMSMKEDDNGKIVDMDINIGGPKAYTLYEPIDRALTSRGPVITMNRHKETGMIMSFLAGSPQWRKVKAFLMIEAEKALSRWTPEEASTLFWSKEFVEQANKIVQKANLGRDAATAMTILLIGKLLDWNVGQIVDAYLSNEKTVRTKTLLYKDTMREVYGEIKAKLPKASEDGKPRLLMLFESRTMSDKHANYHMKPTEVRMLGGAVEIKSRDLWSAFNASLKEANPNESIGTGQWGHVLEELGWVKSENWVQVGKRDDVWYNTTVIQFDQAALANLGVTP